MTSPAGGEALQVPVAPAPGAPFRPRGGAPPMVPPPDVPLAFLAASGAGLVAFGVAIALVTPSSWQAPDLRSVVATTHLGMLAFLSAGVLGALHQFTPVVTRRALRSTAAARATAVGFVVAAATLPLGFATSTETLVRAAGVLAFAAVALAAWNLSGPLSARVGVPSVTGLRWSVALLVVTAGFGVTYAVDRHAGWFPLLPERLLAHAHLGLLGWLGLTYAAVGEKLWPMFLLAHRPGPGAGRFAVRLIPAGVVVVVIGLLASTPPVVLAGALVTAAGLGCHLVSLVDYLRRRRRRPELLHAYILASAAALVAAGVLAAVGGLADLDELVRTRVVVAEIAALVAWLGLALVGHAHKVVPFITWTVLRSRGISSRPGGGPLLFSDLYHAGVARATFAAAVVGFGVTIAGVLGPWALVRFGGGMLAVTGLLVLVNLAAGPLRVIAAARKLPPSAPIAHQEAS